MEDEIDIYADLPNFNVGDNENLAEKNKKLSQQCTKLEKQVTDLTQSLESLRKVNTNLEVNLSSLLQTAKAEIARKDRMIADIRRELENMQFRRGEYSRPNQPARPGPPTRKRENSPKESSHFIKVPEVQDITEYMCNNPPPSINLDNADNTNKSHQLDGIVSTVFGERLRKRILEEQEEERKQREQAKARAEADSKNASESIRPDHVVESDSQSGLKAESLKSDCKVSSIARLRDKGSSLGSRSSINSQEDLGSLNRNHFDRKRQLENQPELASSHKKSKINNGKSRYHDSSRYSDRETRSSFKNSSKIKTDEQHRTEIPVPYDQAVYHIVDEYEAPVENNFKNRSDSINVADENETQDRHNRVAIRLMLLAEGIDPDVEAKKSVQNEEKIVVEDNREGHKKSDEISRSRSKSKNRRHNHRSRSRRRSRQREDRHRPSRDRFQRRRESKNKDGDNLSEFSREICELKERIEHRDDDQSSDRTRKGRSLNRHKRNDERICKSRRSRTPDSSRSGSKERTVHRSRADKQYGRSRSQERYNSRNRGKRCSDFDDISIQHSETVVPERDRNKNVEKIPNKDLPQVTENPETKSLISLEDGEIVDSVGSSPVRIVNPVQSSTKKTLPSDCQFNLSNSTELVSVIHDVKYSLPLREIGNSQKNEKSLLLEKAELSIPLNNSPIPSGDERIENITEFTANFATDVSKSKRDKKSGDKIIHNDVNDTILPNAFTLEEDSPQEKVQHILNTAFQGSSKDIPLVKPPIENSNAVSTKNLIGNNGDDDWCLIAIDSPIKNFEENRKNRMMAQNLQLIEKLEPPKTLLTEDPSLKHLNNPSETLCDDESHRKMASESEKIVSDKSTKPLVQPMKNSSKTKPAVLTSLRSTYHKGRKEMILSDTNSQQCTKIVMPHPINSNTKRLSCESETMQQGREDIKPVKSENIEKLRSKNPVLKNDERNCNTSQKLVENNTVDDLLDDRNDSVNTGKDKEAAADGESKVISMNKVDLVTVARRVDETTKKNGKSKASNSKTDKEKGTKIGRNPKPELRNNMVKESKNKQSTACKTDSTIASKGDVARSIGSKNKTGCKVEKTDDNEESNLSKSLENGVRPAKTVYKVKVEGTNSKPKKETQKLIVSARRRKPVHLEDSSTSSSVVMNSDSISDTDANNSEKSTNNDIKPSNFLDVDRKFLTEHNSDQGQRTIVKIESANDH